MKHALTTRRITRAGVLAAVAAILYALPGIPIITSIYKLDFSNVPVILAGLMAGPLDAIAVLLVKDLTGLLHSSSMGVGELADFLTCIALILPVCLINRGSAKPLRLVVAFASGIVAMALVGALVNYYVMIPFYVAVMNFPLEGIIAMIQGVIPAVDSLLKLVLYATAPFNLLKGTIVCAMAYPVYRALMGISRRHNDFKQL